MKNTGQTALILILLTAAALIFLAITMNWGRIAQVKSLVSVATDESVALLASEVASYGEMQKQTNLGDVNKVTQQTGTILSFLLIVFTVIVLSLVSFGVVGGAIGSALHVFSMVLAVASTAMAVANLALQLTVVQPGITSMWNKLQQNQPLPQQIYEQGIATAIQNSIGDQVNITDYLDWNANGKMGNNASGFPNDTARFAVFYTDRLKMLNTPPIPQVVFFENQLSELMNGETCAQNENDYSNYPGVVALNPACAALNGASGQQMCIINPIDPACQVKIPNGFQLNDACTGSDPGNIATYSPYCDPCCQPATADGKAVRPVSSCPSGDANCSTNNPYGASYLDIYDPAFQNYNTGVSFLAQLGRDQQMGPFTTSLTSQGSANNNLYFPNGVYPFFWLMKDYNPEVDNINPGSLQPAEYHWCAAGGTIPAAPQAPAGFLDLAQLNLTNASGYICQGPDCCVNYLANSVVTVGGVPTPSGGATTNGVIDMVGSPSMGTNPALDASFADPGAGASWVEGDNQMCLNTWPYNGASSTGMPDGTCEWTNSGNVPPPVDAPPPAGGMTADSLDDAMHTLSDFVHFSSNLIDKDVGTLSSTFSTWFPQADGWIDPATGRLPPLVGELNTWKGLMTNWLGTIYTNSNAWCLPPGTTGSVAEDTYINANGGPGVWGDLPHVISCLNYNSNQSASVGSVYNYTQCQSAFPASGNCPNPLPAACASSSLGRSLAGAAPDSTISGACNANTAGSYAKWVSDSLTLATDEAPKFALRSKFLSDTYARALTMQNIFGQGYNALNQFLLPCAGANCSQGGPAAQLIYANGQPSPTTTLPNSVIYGWVDNAYTNGQPGLAHLVKVTVYSVGRNGSSNLPAPSPGGEWTLPKIITKVSGGFFQTKRSYTLEDRDGWVYVSVRRWDEDHSKNILFPNGRPLWQFLFHNPTGVTTTGQGLIQACNGVTLPGNNNIGFGLEPQTAAGLAYANISSQDQTSLSNAFMLNDNVNGTVDPNSHTSAYATCLSLANQYLAYGTESHMCGQYIASLNASGSSGDGDSDYSIKFVSCGQQPEDLTVQQ